MCFAFNHKSEEYSEAVIATTKDNRTKDKRTMGKWSKYQKNVNTKWEKEAAFKNWLQPTTEEDCLKGKPKAYCKLCNTHTRAHHSDLLVHSKSSKHKDKEKSLNRNQQPSLHDYGHVEIKDEGKVCDIRLAMYIACHCSVKSIDHLGEILKVLGKGSPLENTRLHRTKCSKLISSVVAPEFLTELINDVGDSKYALIIDGGTDVSVTKLLGICIRYFSKKRRTMVTDFLCILEVVSCTGEDLAKAIKEYLNVVGLPFKNFNAIGTDRAPNMCGLFKTLYAYLKKDLPN